MTLALAPDLPPLLRCVAVLGQTLDDAADCSATFLSTADKALLLHELESVQRKVSGLQLEVLANADDVAAESGTRSVKAWLRAETLLHPGAAKRAAELAEDLAGHPAVLAAVRGGTMSAEHARVITAAVAALPEEVPMELRALAEEVLITQAARFDPKDLKRLGDRILEVVAPDQAHELVKKQLDRDDAQANRQVSVRFRNLGGGITRLTADLKSATAGMLQTALHAWASPRRDKHASGQECGPSDAHGWKSGVGRIDPATGEQIPHDRVLGWAFTSLVEHLDPVRLPRHGQTNATRAVTIDVDKLRSGLGLSPTSTGEVISPGELRRLSCTAGIPPVVLGGKSEVLDLGRQRRLFSGSQRKALAIRDQRCRAHGCTVPAAWCEAHHANPWSAGGRTDLADGVLFCSWHHHRAHDPDYDMRRLPSGDYRFHRRS